jgi:hypothetical protein
MVRTAVSKSPLLDKVLKNTGYHPTVVGHEGRRGVFKIVGDHCGAGKTRKYIAKAIRSGNHRKVYALGPTRVVAREIYSSLRNQKGLGTLSLGTSDALDSKRLRGARTTIMSHDSFFQRFVDDKVDLRGALVLIDEFHVSHSTTVALLKLLLAATMRTDLEVVCLSATTPDMMHERTNFPVQDVLIPTVEQRQAYYDAHKKEKGLIIVPSLSRLEKEIGKRPHVGRQYLVHMI